MDDLGVWIFTQEQEQEQAGGDDCRKPDLSGGGGGGDLRNPGLSGGGHLNILGLSQYSWSPVDAS